VSVCLRQLKKKTEKESRLNSMATGGTGKRAWRRWDDVEERLLAHGVKTYGTKNWEKVQQHMCTDRTTKQLSDHWVDRQEQCKELLEKLGPPPRSHHCLCIAFMPHSSFCLNLHC